ncbi:hypothetical protein TWF694_009236 [Orbilia ellipsospora]|uniref:Clr5 domain-containing protein n=1 Tax=Orbilia ellipsospora TaxID=2528407 RepID=A0AAV9XFT6_9PEZI
MGKPWESYREEIRRYYIEEGRPLAEVREILKTKYNFEACKRSYQNQIELWGFKKNVRSADMRAYREPKQLNISNSEMELSQDTIGKITSQKVRIYDQRHVGKSSPTRETTSPKESRQAEEYKKLDYQQPSLFEYPEPYPVALPCSRESRFYAGDMMSNYPSFDEPLLQFSGATFEEPLYTSGGGFENGLTTIDQAEEDRLKALPTTAEANVAQFQYNRKPNSLFSVRTQSDTTVVEPKEYTVPPAPSRPAPLLSGAFLHDGLASKMSPALGSSSSSPMDWLGFYKFRVLPRVTTKSFFCVNDLKIWLEDIIHQPVSFWPLAQPQRRCRYGYNRLYLDDCQSGTKEVSVDIPSEIIASTTFQLSLDRPKGSDSVHYPLKTNKDPSDAVGTSGTSSSNTSSADGYTEKGESFSLETKVVHAGEASPGNNSVPSTRNTSGSAVNHPSTQLTGSGSPNTGGSGNGALGSNPGAPQGYNTIVSTIQRVLPENFNIFFVIECPIDQTVMTTIKMNGTHKDSDLFQNLREKYKLVRGWRHYFSFTTICDIQWIRFKRYSSKSVSNGDGLCEDIAESLPSQSDTDYKIRWYEPPTPIIRPLGRQRIMALYENPQDSMNCSDCLDRSMPKWVGTTLAGSEPKAWGIYGVEGFALFKMMAWAFVINLVTTVTFAPWWLANHPGDLQNAFVPNTIVSVFYFGSVSLYVTVRARNLKL